MRIRSRRIDERGLVYRDAPTSAPSPKPPPASDFKMKEAEQMAAPGGVADGGGSTGLASEETSLTSGPSSSIGTSSGISGGGGGGGGSTGSSYGDGSGSAGGGAVDNSMPLTPGAYASSSSSSSPPQSDFKLLLKLVSAALGVGFIVAVAAALASGNGCLSFISSEERNGHQLKGSVKQRMLIFSRMVEDGAGAKSGGPRPAHELDDAAASLGRNSTKSKRSIGSRIMSALTLKRAVSHRANSDVRGRSRSLDSVIDEDAYIRVGDGRERVDVKRMKDADNIIDADAYARAEDKNVGMTMDLFSPGTVQRSILL
ncbi:hypothetical protein ACHAW5_001514 [Stephanodiscus triporus]|uniref:Uncharacterized protein n=1 Tax=Stephanodiscus triporus TaxID=2934178 RepID=A0ABD3NGH3_9STRA